MEITIGKTAGFCYGVKRAVEGAKEAIKTSKQEIYGLGEIVHNKEVIKDLSDKGMKFIKELEEAKGNVIIRAHGVNQKIYEQAKNQKINVVDFTCPNVLKIHNIADEYNKKGCYIILFGNKDHPENIGTVSHCGKNYFVINDKSEIEEALEDIKHSGNKKVLIISQTTFSMSKFIEYTEELKEKLEEEKIELTIKNTICKATEARQKETEKIAKNQDYMIIIGGKNSSNTKKLYEIATQYCNNVISIETENELNLEEVIKYNKVGIMAGASTPQESIESVLKKIKNKIENRSENEKCITPIC